MARKKEERRRGKKRKNGEHEEEEKIEESLLFIEDREGQQHEGQEQEAVQSTPSWIIDEPSSSSKYSQIEASAPFGLVELDLKAYLRTGHIKMQELIEIASEEGRPIAQDEDIKVLRNAMLDEIKGKELTLATDTDTSLILEDLLRSFSERQTRILADALTLNDSLYKLSRHRFGSHLLQSTLVALQSVVTQEEQEHRKGKRKEKKVVDGSGHELRSAQELILDICKDLNQSLASMMPDAFATHVLRTLLLILSSRSTSSMDSKHRSKKSRIFQKKNQSNSVVKEELPVKPIVPPTFQEALKTILSTLQDSLEKNQIKKFSIDNVAGPTLALIVELSLSDQKETPNSMLLVDSVLDGLVSGTSIDRSDYVEDLMKDSVGSHLLQRLLPLLDQQLLFRFWKVYVKGRLSKLGVHPNANFVIAALIKCLGEEENAFSQACKEIELAGDGLIKNQRTGVLIALIERAQELSQLHIVKELAPNESRGKKKVKSVWSDESMQSQASRAVLKAFGFDEEEEEEGMGEENRGLMVKVLASGKTKKGYRKELKRVKEAKSSEKKTVNEALEEEQEQQNGTEDVGLLHSIQGSLLCQSLLRLREPGNSPLLGSILDLPSLVPFTSNPITVHIILASLQPSADCTFAQRNLLSTKILNEISPILCDKFGSRVIDTLFDSRDAFYKEKIMKKCMESERNILASNYGRYFLKRTNLSLFRKDIGQWKRWLKEKVQANEEEAEMAARASQQEQSEKPAKKKRKVDEELDTILAGL